MFVFSSSTILGGEESLSSTVYVRKPINLYGFIASETTYCEDKVLRVIVIIIRKEGERWGKNMQI